MKSLTKSILIAAGVVLSVGTSRAEPVDGADKFPQIISYNALLQLSPEKRAAYLTSLAEMLVDVEKSQKAGKTSASIDDLERLRREAAMIRSLFPDSMMSLMLPEAKAQTPGGEILPVFTETQVPLGTSTAEGSAGQDLGTYTRGAWSCSGGNSGVKFYDELGACAKTTALNPSHNCANGFTEAKLQGVVYGVTRYCVPNSNWNKLSQARRDELTSASGGVRVTSTVRGKNDAAARELVGGSPTAPSAGATSPPTGATAPPDGTGGAGRSAPPPPNGHNSVTTASVRDMCREDFNCSIVAPHRADFFQDKSLSQCINGANFTTMGPSHTSGSCQHVNSFRISASSPPIACKNPSDLICNPLIFSVHKGTGEPFCIRPVKDATFACKIHSLADKDADFIKSKISGIEEAWNKYRDDFNKVCRGSKVSAQFHCDECKTISHELAAANTLATGDSCGTLVDYQTLKKNSQTGSQRRDH